jgi:hypothetical protein
MKILPLEYAIRKVQETIWVKHVAHMDRKEARRKCYSVAWRELGRARHRWENNSEKDIKEMACDDVAWIRRA